jgi:hypothetical protein
MRNSKALIVLAFLLVSFLASTQELRAIKTRSSSFPGDGEAELLSLNKRVYIIDRNSTIRLNYDAQQTIYMKTSPSSDWNDTRSILFTDYQINAEAAENFVIINGHNIPDEYYLLISFDKEGKTKIYSIKYKTVSDLADIGKNLLSPLSLGGAFSLSLDGEWQKGLSPMVYYHFDYVVEGDKLWSYAFSGSIGLILNPSLASLTNNGTWESLVTVGIGIGIFQNVIISGITYDISQKSFNWFIGINVN